MLYRPHNPAPSSRAAWQQARWPGREHTLTLECDACSSCYAAVHHEESLGSLDDVRKFPFHASEIPATDDEQGDAHGTGDGQGVQIQWPAQGGRAEVED